jgi:hypothetical protein
MKFCTLLQSVTTQICQCQAPRKTDFIWEDTYKYVNSRSKWVIIILTCKTVCIERSQLQMLSFYKTVCHMRLHNRGMSTAKLNISWAQQINKAIWNILYCVTHMSIYSSFDFSLVQV